MNPSMKRCVIIGGAEIRNYEALRQLLRPDDFAVYCDCGLNHRRGLGLEPGLIVGDFDSHENPHLNVETIILPHEKDDTDTVYAVREAAQRGFDDFLLLGVVGGRLDHTLGNLAILLMLDSMGKHAVIADDYSEMEIISSGVGEIEDCYPYFSVLNISGQAEGVTITGARYNLTGAELSCEYPLGVSNEVLPGQTARVSVAKGRVLLIKDR